MKYETILEIDLEKLKNLLDNNVITQEEFNKEKNKILNK